MYWQLALWGLFGGFAAEGLDYYRALKAGAPFPWGRQEPGRPTASLYLIATLIRLAIGGGLALAAAESEQVSTPLAAVAVGVAAPKIVQRLLAASNLLDGAGPADDSQPRTTTDLREPGSGVTGRPEVVSEQ